MPRSANQPGHPAYGLIDAGHGRRLERFGPVVVDRPAPMAQEAPRSPTPWRSADLRFDQATGWTRPGPPPDRRDPPESWPIAIDGVTMELRPTASGGVGLYPEHLANASWLRRRLGERKGATVLNLFAHTGLLTLVAAEAGAAVAHVDSARTAVAWARRNAALSHLADRPVRWLTDDAAAFVAREARRGRRYDGIALDPPSFGHARGGRWRLADGLADLLEACGRVLADDGFMLLTAHTTGLDGDALAALVRGALPSATSVEPSPMVLVAASGAALRLGWSVRTSA